VGRGVVRGMGKGAGVGGGAHPFLMFSSAPTMVKSSAIKEPGDVLDAPKPKNGRWQDWRSRFPRHYIGGAQAPYDFLEASVVRKFDDRGHITSVRVEWTFRFKENTANQNGTVHGGAVFAILDSLVNTAGYYTTGTQTATASGSIRYKRPASVGKVYVASGFAKFPKLVMETAPLKSGRKRKLPFIVELKDRETSKMIASTEFEIVRWTGFRPKTAGEQNLRCATQSKL